MLKVQDLFTIFVKSLYKFPPLPLIVVLPKEAYLDKIVIFPTFGFDHETFDWMELKMQIW